ncbi:phosphoserine aminotransferase-like protein [Hypoxylon crocopeplum]|nr:phosphoserine aminotransferase-like protein [Hypoxylon crocopeplum]
MPSRADIIHFSAGPALLPTATYFDITDDCEVIFMQVGGSGEFSVTKKGRDPEADRYYLPTDYLVTGGWTLKAYQEIGRLPGPEYTNLVTDKFPDALSPDSNVPVEKFSLIFGAQKNIGSTGATVVTIKKDLLPPACPQPSPALLRKLGLPVPPQYSVYMALEAHPNIYKIVPDKSVHSRMNICFRVTAVKAEANILKGATARGLTSLKGHRSVGGIRVNNYNSISLTGAQQLADFVANIAQTQG